MSFVKRVQDSLRRRIKKPRIDESHYYPQVEDCQISTLYWLFEVVFGRRTSGCFVEVGAYDGLFVSNSYGLVRRGWRGLMFEPHPVYANECRNNLRRFPNCKVVETAVGSPGTSELVIHQAGALSTANTTLLAEYQETSWARGSLSKESVRVQSRTLDELLREHEIPVKFDLLIVDVEGLESEVFEGFSINHWQPQMMIVEVADTHPDLSSTQKQDAALVRKLENSGYLIVYKDAINTVFVRRKSWLGIMGLKDGA